MKNIKNMKKTAIDRYFSMPLLRYMIQTISPVAFIAGLQVDIYLA